jgi:prolyl oligopeptidase PreP (S9A serine peptidase family)
MTIMSDASVTAEDPYLWLEEVDGPQARAWVEARNAETQSALGRVVIDLQVSVV